MEVIATIIPIQNPDCTPKYHTLAFFVLVHHVYSPLLCAEIDEPTCQWRPIGVRLRGDGGVPPGKRRSPQGRAVLPRSRELSSGRPFANHPGKNQPARLQGPERNSKLSAVILVLRRQHSEFEGEFLVHEPGFLSFSRSLLRDYCLHPVAIGSLSDAVALCFAESPPEFMLNIVEQNHVLSR